MKAFSVDTNVNVERLTKDLEKLSKESNKDRKENNMTITSFINDCVKCINMCKEEFSNEFAEWMEKVILNEVAGKFENADCIADTKNITKELV